MKLGKQIGTETGFSPDFLSLGCFPQFPISGPICLPIVILGRISEPIWFPILARLPEAYFLPGRLDCNPCEDFLGACSLLFQTFQRVQLGQKVRILVFLKVFPCLYPPPPKRKRRKGRTGKGTGKRNVATIYDTLRPWMGENVMECLKGRRRRGRNFSSFLRFSGPFLMQLNEPFCLKTCAPLKKPLENLNLKSDSRRRQTQYQRNAQIANRYREEPLM